MNPRQRSYDSFNKTNQLLKLANSYYHNKNLDQIRNRKSQYGLREPEKLLHRSKYLEPFKDLYVKQQNKSMATKINKLKWRPVRPKMNSLFSNKEFNIQSSRQKYQLINKTAIENENYFYKKRIQNQKPFISTKNMDKDFKDNHTKTVLKLRQVNDNSECSTLPPIRSPNMTNRKNYQTEGNNKSRKNEVSKNGNDVNERNEENSDCASGN